MIILFRCISYGYLYFYFVTFQSPKIEKVELVNGGYGIKNPLLSQTEFKHGILGI